MQSNNTLINISAVIITFNEGKNIARCIDSLQGVVDEIVVIDSFSTDDTEEICLSKNVKFIKNEFKGHIQQKNFAAEAANYDYILSLDADEALSPTLRNSILKIKNNGLNNAYSFNRMTQYCGKWIKHSGWYPDTKVRIWKKEEGTWGGVNPHDKIILNKNISITHLKGDLLHYALPTIASHVRTMNIFSEIAAKEAFAKGKKSYLLFHIILNPMVTFINKYFFKLGFMDGYYGFVICVLSGFSNFLKYTKLRELNKKHV